VPTTVDQPSLGVCTNPQCARGASHEPIERYPGPGEFCPDCGEPLLPEASEAAAPPPPLAASQNDRRRFFLIAGVVIVACVIIAAIVAVGTQSISALSVRVCSTTMTDRVVDQMVRDYSTRHGEWPYHFTVTRAGDLACDVRFSAAPAGSNDSVIARDAVVAVVNPQNPIVRLDISQLRDVLAGRIVNWSQVGGAPGNIAAFVPDAGTDEAAVAGATVMLAHPFGNRVIRTLDAVHITRFVASPSGVHAIGIVPFSDALPAKVVALGHAPPPSALSIGNERYPMSMRILAESDFRSPSPQASALIAFARSAEANNVVVGTALVSKNGF
jgi:hypothetical protein